MDALEDFAHVLGAIEGCRSVGLELLADSRGEEASCSQLLVREGGDLLRQAKLEDAPAQLYR